MISVLMATYNGRRFIEQQLDSIRLQNFVMIVHRMEHMSLSKSISVNII